MISVAIMVNGNPIMARSAHRIGRSKKGVYKYQCDDGQIIEHDPRDGAIPLAIKLLKTIKE
jgi:hypothetical protein